MNLTEHLLQIASEECSEVSHRISKALRFGLQEVQKNQPLTNAERIALEFDDLLSVMEILRDNHLVPESKPGQVQGKKVKIQKYLNYSRQQGTLQD